MSTATVTPSTRSLRLLPAPAIDPPYDDEVVGGVPVVDGTLALAFPAPTNPIPLRLVPPASDSPVGSEDGSSRPDPAGLPDPRVWGHRLAQAVVEVLAGARSAAQLSRFASLDVLNQLERSAGRLAGRPGAAPVQRPQVVSVRVCEPRPGVAETCAVFDTGRRRRVVALRLEGGHGQWRCTVLQLG